LESRLVREKPSGLYRSTLESRVVVSQVVPGVGYPFNKKPLFLWLAKEIIEGLKKFGYSHR
jgi:hypothetical protein